MYFNTGRRATGYRAQVCRVNPVCLFVPCSCVESEVFTASGGIMKEGTFDNASKGVKQLAFIVCTATLNTKLLTD